MTRNSKRLLAAAVAALLANGCVADGGLGDGGFEDFGAGGAASFDEATAADGALRVVDRLFEGTSARVVFDRALEPGELDLANTFLAADYVTDGGVEQQVISLGAHLEENQQELVFELGPHELLVEGGRYSIIGARADGTEIDLGTLEVPRDHASPTADAQSFNFPLPFPTPFPIPRLPSDSERTNTDNFYIESITPNDLSRDLIPRRDGARPMQFRVTFSGPVGCGENLLPRARADRDPATDNRVFRVTTRMRNSYRTQLMYADPSRPDANDYGYRGRVRCERNTTRNRVLIFEVPGVLLGNAETEVHVAATDRDGYYLAEGSFYYETELPDVLVELTRVQNLRNKSCEGLMNAYKGTRKCDMYVVAYSRSIDGVEGTATINTRSDDELGDALQVGRFPIEGAYFNMNHLEIQNTSATRVFEGPIGPNGLDIRLYAFDDDGNKNAANIARIIGYLTSAICAGIEAYCGGEAAEYGAKFHEAMADQVENNEDDHMGQTELLLRQYNSVPAGWRNWGLDLAGADYEYPWGTRVNVGHVDVWIRIGEATKSWYFSELI